MFRLLNRNVGKTDVTRRGGSVAKRGDYATDRRRNGTSVAVMEEPVCKMSCFTRKVEKERGDLVCWKVCDGFLRARSQG